MCPIALTDCLLLQQLEVALSKKYDDVGVNEQLLRREKQLFLFDIIRVSITSVSIRFVLQQFFNFLRKMSFCAPNKTDHCQHHKNCYQSKPKRFLQHSLRQRSIRYSHSLFTFCSLKPSKASEDILSVSLFRSIAGTTIIYLQ